MGFSALVFLAMMLNKWSVSQRFSTLMLTPTLVGLAAGVYLKIFIPGDFEEGEKTCFFLIQHCFVPLVLFHGLINIDGVSE
jgi:hypothetical protein